MTAKFRVLTFPTKEDIKAIESYIEREKKRRGIEMGGNDINCKKCSVSLKSQSHVECKGCKNLFGVDCANLSKVPKSSLKNLAWLCEDCASRDVFTALSNLEIGKNQGNINVVEFEKRIVEGVKKHIDQLLIVQKEEIAKVVKEVKKLQGEVQELEERLVKLEREEGKEREDEELKREIINEAKKSD